MPNKKQKSRTIKDIKKDLININKVLGSVEQKYFDVMNEIMDKKINGDIILKGEEGWAEDIFCNLNEDCAENGVGEIMLNIKFFLNTMREN